MSQSRGQRRQLDRCLAFRHFPYHSNVSPFAPDARHLQRAIALAVANAESGRGGPFGAVVVDGADRVVAEGTNLVTESHDPTAHAEVVAIRRAAHELRTHDLSNCTIYASCEPCPMCLGAILWARLDRVVFAADQALAAAAGFDDSEFYRQFALAPECRRVPGIHVRDPLANAPFEAWNRSLRKVLY
ncbi:MAG: nucleoside deaminase [Acidobacteria bacterium]|nr:nucleoside deaminase [Acidobacteriota bacterium]